MSTSPETRLAPAEFTGFIQNMRDNSGKVCAKCGQKKKMTDFHVNLQSPTGLRSYCKECRKGSNGADGETS